MEPVQLQPQYSQSDLMSALGNTHVMPFPRERNLYLYEECKHRSIQPIVKAILDINAHDEMMKRQYKVYDLEYKPSPIKLYIDSYGGEVAPTLGLISVMLASKTELHTIVTGVAYSAAFLLLIVGKQRFAYEYSKIMYHQISAGTWGDLKSMQEDLEERAESQKTINDIIVKYTGITSTMLLEASEKKLNVYFQPKKALEYKCIDTIIS